MLKKLIQLKFIMVVVWFRPRDIADVTKADQRLIFFLFLRFLKIVFDKVYVSAYHSNPLFMKNMKMIIDIFFSKSCGYCDHRLGN